MARAFGLRKIHVFRYAAHMHLNRSASRIVAP